jgi:hypothetical protein
MCCAPIRSIPAFGGLRALESWPINYAPSYRPPMSSCRKRTTASRHTTRKAWQIWQIWHHGCLELPIALSVVVFRHADRKVPSAACTQHRPSGTLQRRQPTHGHRMTSIAAIAPTRSPTACEKQHAVPNAGNCPSFKPHLLSLLECRAEYTILQHDTPRPYTNCLNSVNLRDPFPFCTFR